MCFGLVPKGTKRQSISLHAPNELWNEVFHHKGGRGGSVADITVSDFD